MWERDIRNRTQNQNEYRRIGIVRIRHAHHDTPCSRRASLVARIGDCRRRRRAGAVAGGVTQGSRAGEAAGGAAARAAAQQPAGVERNPHRSAAVHEHSRARNQRADPAAGADVARAARARGDHRRVPGGVRARRAGRVLPVARTDHRARRADRPPHRALHCRRARGALDGRDRVRDSSP